ncbi:MAG: shikimate dehydrogenase [Bacillota bacterium]
MSKVNLDTQVLGLIGYPLGHSISPLIHNYALEYFDLNFVYLAFDLAPEKLKAGINGFRALNVKGVNVTIPHKREVLSLLDEVDDIAQKIGAVNTIVNQQGQLKGYNTDVTGFRRMIEDDGGFSIPNKSALIIGAGGASRAVGTALCEGGIKEIYLVNRTLKKAEKLASFWQDNYPQVSVKAGELNKDFYVPLLGEIDLVVDTTPVGMEPNIEQPPVIATEKFHPGMLVVDLVYNPAQTTILKAAKKQGAETINGLPMLLYQAAEAFKMWTGCEPEVEHWYRLLEKETDMR